MANYNISKTTYLSGLNWRRLTKEDLVIVEETILLPEARAMFGDRTLTNLLETSLDMMVYENPRCHELLSIVSLKIYPNVPALHKSIWIDWMENLYNNFDVTSLNTLFVHWLAWCDPTYRSFDVVANLKKLFNLLFTDHISLQYIIFILPPGFSEIKSFQILLQIETLYRIYPTGYGKGDNVQSLLVCDRNIFFEKILIRRAVAEDNDDLVEILDVDCKELRHLYGDYYIAEIVLKEDSTRKIIVAEYDNRAIGMICVNSDVRIDHLYDYFELEPFHGLRKHAEYESVAYDEIESEEPETEPAYSQPNDSMEMTIKEPSDIEHSIENWGCDETRDRTEDTVSVDPFNFSFTDETCDIFEKYAFNSSSSSDSSMFDQNWTSEFSMFQTHAEMEMDVARQMRKNSMSHTDLIWGELSFNSSIRFDYKSKLKYSSGFAFIPKSQKSGALIIELHGTRKDFDKRLTYLLLEAVFEIFPNHDYCLITLPSYGRSFPGLEYFMRPIPRPFLQYEHQLYLLYKYTLYGKLEVRIATNDDLPEVTEFFNIIPKSSAVIQTIEELLSKYFQLKFVINIYSNRTLIGLAILEVCRELYLLKTNFDTKSFVTENRLETNGFLKYFILAPMFQNKFLLIMAEVMRLTGFHRLFCFVKDSNRREPHTIILPYMFPIRPRRRIVYHPEKLDDHIPPDYIMQEPPLIALYTIGINNLRQRKRMIPTRIVVVGPSTTALSFLETIIFEKSAQKYNFINLVLISPHGHFESKFSANDGMALARPADIYYNYKYLQRLSLRSWVNVVHGYVVYIDKRNKCITISCDRQVQYDILYIFTGLEFSLPKSIPHSLTTPRNFLTVNTCHDTEILGIKLRLILQKRNTYNIVVYGQTIEAYCIVNYLLQAIQAESHKNIVFVLPAMESNWEFPISAFNDEFVKLSIKSVLDSSAVRIYDGYKITNWDLDNGDLIRTIVLESNFEIFSLQCSLLISCERKIVRFNTIKTFNDSGLVFDGRLVINESFQTNDPNIYAAGPVTKYKRILYADEYRHEFFNSAEIGRELALQFVTRLDEQITFFTNSHFPLVIHKFKLPVSVSCVLPSNLNFLCVRAPGPMLPHTVAILKDNYGVDIMTGHQAYINNINYKVSNEISTSFNKIPDLEASAPDEETKKSFNYFRCHLNEFNLVTTIVCLSSNPIDVQNIVNLYGKHEKLLNNLMIHNEMNLLDDLFNFFQNSWWFYVVAHDHFSCLQRNNRKLFLDSARFPDKSLINDFFSLLKKSCSHKLTDESKLLIVGNYLYSNQPKIKKNVLEFLNEYHDELPMFICPRNVDQFVDRLTLAEVFEGIEELFVKESEL